MIEIHGGTAVRAKYAARLERSRRRKDPTRPKRGSRGSYKSRKRVEESAGMPRRSAEDAWGMPPAGGSERFKTSNRCSAGSESSRPLLSTGNIDSKYGDATATRVVSVAAGSSSGTGSKRKSALNPVPSVGD